MPARTTLRPLPVSAGAFMWLIAAICTISLSNVATAVAAQPCTQYYSSATPVPAGWGAAYDVFVPSKPLFLSLDCTVTGTVPILVGAENSASQYVYRFAYLMASDQSAWTPITLGSATASSGDWFAKQASGALTLSSGELTQGWNFIAFLVAYWNGSQWLFGCADVGCATPAWSLQAIAQEDAFPTAITLFPNPVNQVDTSPAGTVLSTASVTMSDGSTYAGTISLAGASGLFSVSGLNIVAAVDFSPADDGTYLFTVTVP